MMVAVFIAIPVFDYAHVDTKLAMWLTWACASICGAATAIVGGALGGMVGMLPGNYFGALMAGQGVAGIIVGILRVITKASIETGSVVTKERT